MPLAAPQTRIAPHAPRAATNPASVSRGRRPKRICNMFLICRPPDCSERQKNRRLQLRRQRLKRSEKPLRQPGRPSPCSLPSSLIATRETLDPWLCAGRFPGLCLFGDPYAVLAKYIRGRGTRCRAPPPPSGSLGPRKARPCFRSGSVVGRGRCSACAVSPATRTGDCGSRPPKAGRQATYGLLAWFPMLTSRRLLLLSRCSGRTRSKTGRPPITLLRLTADFQAEPLRLLANYRPAGKGRQY